MSMSRREVVLSRYLSSPGFVLGMDDRMVTKLHDERKLEYNKCMCVAGPYTGDYLYGFRTVMGGVVVRFYVSRDQGDVEYSRVLGGLLGRYSEMSGIPENRVLWSPDVMQPMGRLLVSGLDEFVPISYMPFEDNHG